MPGDAGYARAALSTERSILIFAGGRDTGASKDVNVSVGQFFGTYLVQDASSGHWRAKNPSNDTRKQPVAFFSVANANPDSGLNHALANWSTNASGTTELRTNWEDITGGGDRDYNDAVITTKGLQASTNKTFVYDAKANDIDGDTLSYSLSQAPAGASINAATGQLTWANPQAGSHSFTISVNDGKGGTAQQTFTLKVSGPNTAPKAKSASYNVDRNASIKLDLRGLISDAENDVLTLMVSNPTKGTLTKNADGTYTYTYKPNRNYTGTDSFTYTVSDGKTSTTATVTLKVGQGEHEHEGGRCD